MGNRKHKKHRKLQAGNDVIIDKLGVFGRVQREYRIDGAATIAVEITSADRLVVSVSPLELTRREAVC